MTSQQPLLDGDSTWANLVRLEPNARATAIRERFDEVMALPGGALDAKIEEMIRGEDALSATDLHAFTAAPGLSRRPRAGCVSY